MEYALPPINSYAHLSLSGQSGAFVHNTINMQDAGAWTSSLNVLRDQRGYLEDLLAKTITKLNALRDKQTRNERSLNAHPEHSRSKKKKISQNKWRTNKTISTCENEERVILDCLNVCRNNIDALESLLHSVGCPPAQADYNSTNSYTGSEYSGIQWTTGWTEEDEPFSPFEFSRGAPNTLLDLAPDEGFGPGPVLVGDSVTHETHYATLLPPHERACNPHASNSASRLSPKAAVFEPSPTNNMGKNGGLMQQVDKLSISGLLSSMSMKKQLCGKSFSSQALEQSMSRASNGERHGSQSSIHRRRSAL
ncbi:unnamed protein product [Periconia digitata]|uniref:Uncharacterized protein n=1 Tax=Periconia digitata TaxID=1303443 RepID=A0A9W4UTW8_9PLEO|nr:unnamed protein product [Periconia digitata]